MEVEVLGEEQVQASMASSTTGLPDPFDDAAASRLGLLKLSLCGGLAALTTTAVAKADEPVNTRAQMGPTVPDPALPIVDARFPAEIAPGVFVLPDKRISLVPNIGIVVGRDLVLVVDCGLGPESGESVIKLARQLAPGRSVVLTVTHAHPEHGFGAQAFKPGARIFYNAAQRDYFARSSATLLAGFRTGLPAEQKYLLDGVVFTPPDQTYDGKGATLDLGGRRVEFRTWGTAHSPGDQIIHLPEERIVFIGDLIEERMFPIVPFYPPMIVAGDIDVACWEAALSDVLALQPHLIVPGHGNLGGPEIATNLLDCFTVARAVFGTTGVPGVELDQRFRAKYPTWEHSERIEPARQYFAQLPI
jgi:glyoxylase-like metal-dependent hydrolase (beta-lactamase superfamily II)